MTLRAYLRCKTLLSTLSALAVFASASLARAEDPPPTPASDTSYHMSSAKEFAAGQVLLGLGAASGSVGAFFASGAVDRHGGNPSAFGPVIGAPFFINAAVLGLIGGVMSIQGARQGRPVEVQVGLASASARIAF